MWHLKTKLGIFWVAPVSDTPHKYYLGLDDHELGLYTEAEQAARDVHDQATGYLKWDVQKQVNAPEHITEWKEGEPKDWSAPKA